MKNRIIQLLLFTVLFLSLGCKKELLPPSSGNDPVFFLSNSIDGNQSNIAAGNDGYYMFADFSMDDDSIYTFSGTLKEENCNNDCGSEIRIEIRDFQKAHNPANLFYSLHKGSYVYQANNATPMENIYRLFVEDRSLGAAPIEYEWEFEDDMFQAIIKDVQNPVFNLIKTIGMGTGEDKARLNIVDAQGNESFTEHTRIPLRSWGYCKAGFNVTLLGNGKMELEAEFEGEEPFAVEWNTGDTTKTIEVDAVDSYYSLRIISSNSCSNTFGRSLKIVNNDIQMATAEFGWNQNFNEDNVTRFTGGRRLHFGTVRLIYKDSNGQIFSSDLESQSKEALFEIIDVEDYLPNEDGKATKKLTIKYDCDVWSESGQKKRLSGEGSIAVAHP